jgi:lipopolysaccharide export system permease protein
MGSINRYIFRNTLGAFLLVLISLTTAIWLTQALREFDLITNQGQTVLIFLGITSLIIPVMVVIIAPLALVIAVSHVLNKLSADSEIIVISGAGMAPRQLFQPLVAVTLIVTVALAGISAYVAPKGLRMLRERIAEVRADLVTNIVQPGRFTPIDRGLALHIRERRPNGALVGVLLDDARDPQERITILAEQGQILKNEHGSFLVLEDGSIQRRELKQHDPNIVRFDRYAFDLSRYSNNPLVIKYTMRERYLWQLVSPDINDPQFRDQPKQFWAELHDRVIGLLYPIVFVVIAFVFLGTPRTTRQSPVWPIAAIIGGVLMLRIVGFANLMLTVNYPSAAVIQYVVMAAALAGGLYAISRGLVIEPPELATRRLGRFGDWFMRRIGLTAEARQ